MYQIISMTGEILTETNSPIFSKFNPVNGAWILTNENDADCVVVNGKRCIIYGKAFAADSDKVVFVKKIDDAEKFLQDKINFDNDNLDIIEAIIEMDKKIDALYQSLEAAKNG